jgi:phage baseplate assembly protein W
MASETISTFSRNFRDLDLNFQIHPIRKDINLHTNEMAVINSVKNLILTNYYERPFRPEIGSGVRSLLFENIDSVVAAQLERAIEETILNFEPRVQISKITALPSPDENAYKIIMEFFIINLTNPISITFFLERIR